MATGSKKSQGRLDAPSEADDLAALFKREREVRSQRQRNAKRHRRASNLTTAGIIRKVGGARSSKAIERKQGSKEGQQGGETVFVSNFLLFVFITRGHMKMYLMAASAPPGHGYVFFDELRKLQMFVGCM